VGGEATAIARKAFGKKGRGEQNGPRKTNLLTRNSSGGTGSKELSRGKMGTRRSLSQPGPINRGQMQENKKLIGGGEGGSRPGKLGNGVKETGGFL